MEKQCISPSAETLLSPDTNEKLSTSTDHLQMNDESYDKSEPVLDKTLLIYKVFYFLFFAGFGSTFPYLGIYFKQLGLNATYVGVLSGARPLVQFVSGPIWAFIADKYHCRKLVLCMSIMAWLIMTVALALPQAKGTKCQELNTTNLMKRDGYSSNTIYPSLVAPPLTPTITKKSEIGQHSNDKKYPTVFKILYDSSEMRKIFYILLVLVVLGEFVEAPSFIILDAALLQYLQEKCHDYGKTRLFGSIGYGLASLGVGVALDFTSYEYCGKNMTNYLIIFYFFAAFMGIAFLLAVAVLTFRYTEEVDNSAKSIWKVYTTFFSFEYASFLWTIWFMGMGNGAQMTFINWYLEDLGISKIVMGFATTIRAIAVLTGFLFSGAIIAKFGEMTTTFFSLIIFAVIFFGYSCLLGMWMVFPLEILQGGVYAISWSTCVIYLSNVTPSGAAASMQSILQGIYWGLGTGIGAIIGGILVNSYGVIWMYRAGAVASLGVALQFLIARWIVGKRKTNENGH